MTWDKRIQMVTNNANNEGLKMSFQFKGQRGAVEAIIYTRWKPEKNRLNTSGASFSYWPPPRMGPVLFHSPIPLGWPGDEIWDGIAEECGIIGGPCYIWSGLLSEREAVVLEALIEGGEDAVWSELAEMYNERFGPDTPEREILYRKFGGVA
jgi:hypothetical protein